VPNDVNTNDAVRHWIAIVGIKVINIKTLLFTASSPHPNHQGYNELHNPFALLDICQFQV
jgi:hypothetical protein